MRIFARLLVAAAFSVSPAAGSIVGGKSVPITAAPWQLLFYPDGGMCGAILINDSTALSAAHCVDGAAASRSVVHHGITRTSQANSSNRIGIRQIIPYPNWNLSRDIAILRLAAKVPSTSLARPIRYATAADATAGLTAPGKECMATGWGGIDRNVKFPDSLQQVFSVVYNSNQTGVIQWAGQGGTANVGSCQGDSGGPLVVRDASGTGWIAAGISSYIQSFCGDPRNPSSYARISAFASWLVQNGVVQPNPTPAAPGILAAPWVSFPDRAFALARPEVLDLSVLDMRGATVYRAKGRYAAGRHALPEGLAAGNYLVRIRAEAWKAQSRWVLAP